MPALYASTSTLNVLAVLLQTPEVTTYALGYAVATFTIGRLLDDYYR